MPAPHPLIKELGRLAELDFVACNDNAIACAADRFAAAAQTHPFDEATLSGASRAKNLYLQQILDGYVQLDVSPLFRAIFAADPYARLRFDVHMGSNPKHGNAIHGLNLIPYRDMRERYLRAVHDAYDAPIRQRLVDDTAQVEAAANAGFSMSTWLLIANGVAVPSAQAFEPLVRKQTSHDLIVSLFDAPFTAKSPDLLRLFDIPMDENFAHANTSNGTVVVGPAMAVAISLDAQRMLAHLLQDGVDPNVSSTVFFNQSNDQHRCDTALELSERLGRSGCAAILLSHAAKSQVDGVLKRLAP